MTRDAFDFEHYDGPLPKVNGKLLRKTFERVFEEAQKPTMDDIYDKHRLPEEAETEMEELAKTTGICRWNQADWFDVGPPCGTAGCFAGWAYMVSEGEPPDPHSSLVPASTATFDGMVIVSDWAMVALGLTVMEAETLFSAHNEIEDLRQHVNTILTKRTRSKIPV